MLPIKKTAMKSTLLIYIIVLTAMSCSKEFDLTDHYDPTQSFKVIDQEKPKDDNSSSEILVNDLKHAQLLSWLELNNQNWKPTHNTHAGLVIIYQEKFRLLLYRHSEFGVVIITDDKNISHYYKKIFNTGGLEFLDK
jgi:hypothetical protein